MKAASYTGLAGPVGIGLAHNQELDVVGVDDVLYHLGLRITEARWVHRGKVYTLEGDIIHNHILAFI